LWWWFAGGFLIVFVGILLFATILAMHPSGQAVVQYPLWQYYVVEISQLPRAFFGPSYLGPTSGSTSAFAETLGQHILVSLAGGCVAAGVRWLLSKRQGRGSA
jgi:hypothetical protein